MIVGKTWVSLVGELLPGGRNGVLVGESGRPTAGVVGRETLMLDAGRIGGGILESVPAILRRRAVGDGQGEICAKVSMALSDKEGLCRRFTVASGLISSLSRFLGFSSPSSKMGASEFDPGGVVSKDALRASRRASRTGDTLLERMEPVQSYLDFSE